MALFFQQVIRFKPEFLDAVPLRHLHLCGNKGFHLHPLPKLSPAVFLEGPRAQWEGEKALEITDAMAELRPDPLPSLLPLPPLDWSGFKRKWGCVWSPV